ncbi:MAG TPA: hypothetical protein VH165_11670 [Kofleriaceae bacterium]|jgi:hypothetical protein|nr:hypothetical protein [Kofleriaceae bacterium]
MKIRKQLGSEAVQDLIREAHECVKNLPPMTLHDPWPSSRWIQPEEARAFFEEEQRREKLAGQKP